MLRLQIIASFAALFCAAGYAQSGSADRVTWQPSYSGSCQDCRLVGQQMPYWDLSNAHYGRADLSYSTLHGSEAEGTYFTQVTALHTDFSRANLRNAHFQGARMNSARLIGVDASGADFSGATLDRIDAREAKLIGTNLSDVSAIHMLGFGADFSAANAPGAKFDFATLRGAIFNGALLRNTSFIEADVAGASFRDVRFQGANLARMIGYAQADFSGACRSTETLMPPELRLPFCSDSGLAALQSEAP
ncbi:MAG: pentapeptide repeat-containing protein [Pseudomonadota bacterium]